MPSPIETEPDRPDSAAGWVKSSLSFSNGNCVEVTGLPDGCVAVRNSREPHRILAFTSDEWHAFLDGVRKREFDHLGN